MWSWTRSLLALILILQDAVAQTASKRKKKDEDSAKVQMMHHSFSTPLGYDNSLGDWRSSGSTISIRDRVLLNPAVSERGGLFFSKQPVLTNDFEVTFSFKVAGTKEVPNQDQTFAFWYVQENISSSYNEGTVIKGSNWMEGLKQAGFDFIGMKPKFEGWGVVFSTLDDRKSPKPVISGIVNDGTKSLELFKDVPKADSKNVDFRNTLNAAQMKIRMTPTSLEGALKLSPSLSWIECFKITGTFKSGGYPGFSAWTGSTGKEADSVSLISMSMYNYDTTSIGEDLSMDVSKEIQEAYREMLTDEKRHFKDQKSQKEHLQRLTNMLSNHMQQVKPQEQEMFTKLGNLQDKMHKLEEGCKTLRQEIRVVLGNGSSTAVSSMKTELIGLRHIFMKDSQAHSQKIDSVRETVGTVKKADDKKVDPNALLLITEKTDKLEKTIQASSSQVSWMMIFLIVAVLGIGVLMYNRMRYYEKKHFI